LSEANYSASSCSNMSHWSTFERETERETKKLIRCISGVQDEEDQNFQLALKFAWSNFNILSLLLFLSDSPSNTNFTERPRVKDAEPEDNFDWAKYLMEGEEIDTGPFPDTPEWSEDESEDDDRQQPISREDSGIQLDKTPQEDRDTTSKVVPNCLHSVLEHIAVYGQAVFRLQRFIDEVTGHSSEPCPPGSGSSHSYRKGSEPPFRTYQAFVWALNKYFTSFKEELTTIEREVISNETVRPYLEIVDEWIVHGHLFDPAKEFIIQRNKDVPVNHRDFWYATYTLYSVSEMVDNEEKLNDAASGSSGGDQGSSNRQLTMVSFLKPVLKQIIMAGKSMQLLRNLHCKEAEDSERSSRGQCFCQ
ncbi:hypothetical protein XENOCAPTIV_022709, partial [Xenoophorus captivus]